MISLIGLGTNVYGQTTWDGSESSNWDDPDNWSNGVPDDFNNPGDVTIPSTGNDPIINGTNCTIVGAFDVQSGVILTLTNGAQIQQQSGSFTNNGSIVLNSETEFRTNQTVLGSGTFKYNRTLTANWHLISSPFEGETIQDLISNHTFATGSGSNIGLAPYNTVSNSWEFYNTGTTGTLNTGEGYSVKLASAGDISFTGTLLTTNKSIALATSNLKYDLVGNPYPIHINSNLFLERSTSSLDEKTLWVWNQSTSSYEEKVSGIDFKVAPAQGFFVKSTGGSPTLDINESDAIFQGTDTFLRTDPRPEINITLSDESSIRQTRIYYIDGTTTGFDNGFDGSVFGGVVNEFAIYTHAVENGIGRDLGTQSLPTDNYENMVIPVGINADSGTTISIEASTVDFPEGMNIYLEDKEDDSFTLLDGDANFTTTLASELNGIGRFYLHTTTGSLSADDLSTNNNISIYNSSRENLRIVGVQNGTAKVQLYNILGKEVFSNTFEGTGVNDIQLPSLAEGLYIVNLLTVNGKTNKKIIIQ